MSDAASSLTAEQKLHRKLFLARKEAKPVEKKGKAAEGFDFARFEDVVEEAGRLLDKRGILIVPQVLNEQLQFSSKEFAIATATMEFEVVDKDGGGSLKVRWSGTGYDAPGHKALFAAQTGCEKTFLLKLLRIPYGDDPEANTAPSPAQEAQPGQSAEAQQIAREQDQAAEEPDLAPRPRHLKPIPASDLPEPDWSELSGGDASA